MPTVALVSLGCAKNLVDSELILGRLAEAGCEITTDPVRADIIIVNTCGFIQPAKEEAINALLEAACWKKKGRCRLVVGAGCLVQRYGNELARGMPEIDLWVTRAHYEHLDELIEEARGRPGMARLGPPEIRPDSSWPRLRSTPPYQAYLRIADGCDNRCRYCVIPSVRGSLHSRPPEDIMAEARILAEQGVAEVVLIAQDTGAYGLDLPGRPTLAGLLRSLLAIQGPRWWRVLYTHPARVGEELIDLLAEEERLCRYIDLPLQHVSRRVLQRMGRPEKPGEVAALLERLRERVPGIVLRTTLMVGFPGETEEEFAELKKFTSEQRFNWLGVFAYSREEGTPAARMRGRIPAEVKEDRRGALLMQQREITRAWQAGRVGKILQVLVERPHPDRQGYWLARSAAEAPEVDGVIHLRMDHGRSGEFLQARVTKAGTYDLEAIPVRHQT